MEQAATRLLVRDQVESLLENVSPFVPAITLFPPEEAKMYRQHLTSTMCLCVPSEGKQAHISRSSISALCLSRLQDTAPCQLGVENATQDPPASPPRRDSTSSATSTMASLLRDPSQQSHRLTITTLLSTDASPSNAPGNTKRAMGLAIHLTSLHASNDVTPKRGYINSKTPSILTIQKRS